jgi:hypothetical protein
MIIRRTVRPGGAVSPGPTPGGTPTGGAMPGVSAQGAAKGWTPTVANLMVLLVLEIVAFGVIRYVFKRVT